MTAAEDSWHLTLLGSSGGAAKAVLSILNQSVCNNQDPLQQLMKKAKIHLVDLLQKDYAYYESLCPNLRDQMILYQFDLRDLDRFRNHLQSTTTKLVIDVAWADTNEMISVCNELGVLYVNSALENTGVDEDETLFGFPLAERYHRFEACRSGWTNTTAIVCSGMNPGVVQWMALQLMRERPDERPLACYIVEHDSSFFEDRERIQPRTLYTSWSTECFLDEAILSYPMFVAHHTPLYIYEEVYESEYKVRLGEKHFYGCLMPHEEVLTLGALFDMETGFLYRVNEHTTQSICSNLDNTDDLWKWEQQLIDPDQGEVSGEDLVGVLLVYAEDETYLYNTMKSSDIYAEFKTNATYNQVACGIYAGTASLLLDPLPQGVRYVDELLLHTSSKYGDYLQVYMKHFVTGRNPQTDGLLYNRKRPLMGEADLHSL